MLLLMIMSCHLHSSLFDRMQRPEASLALLQSRSPVNHALPSSLGNGNSLTCTMETLT